MKFYAVYNLNDEGSKSYVDSYWLDYAKAVARFKKLWFFVRDPDQHEIDHYIEIIETED